MTRDPRPRSSRALAAVLATLVPVGLALVGLAFLPAYAGAATRPYYVTESALTLPPGGMRLEAGFTREDWDTGNKFYGYNAELTYNLHPNLDLEASVPWVVAGGRVPLNDGFGDVRARAKINLAKESGAFPATLSGLVEVKFPTGIDLVSTQEADLRLAGLATKAVGTVTVDGNLSYTFVGERRGQNFRNVIGLSVGASSRTSVAGLTALGEFMVEQSRTPGGSTPFALLAGARYAVSPGLALDFGGLIGWGPGPLPGPGPDNYQRGLAGNIGLTWDIGP